MLTRIVNALIDLLVLMLNSLIALLPETPFSFSQLNWGPFADAIGLVFPVAAMATHFTLLLTAFGSYYVVRWALRLIRQIQ